MSTHLNFLFISLIKYTTDAVGLILIWQGMWKCLWLLLMVFPEPAEINGRFIEITPLRKHTHAMDAGIMFPYLNQVNEEREVQEISARNVIFQLSNYALLNMNYAFGLWTWFIFMLINGHLIIYQH